MLYNFGAYSGGFMSQQRYRSALQALAQRTGTPLPSLIISFAFLHELTAIVPFTSFYLIAHSSRLGISFVDAVQKDTSTSDPLGLKSQCKKWVEDGENWARKVGRRYGIWGIAQDTASDAMSNTTSTGEIAGEVANVILAYTVTKVGDAI
jgi:hypothetical protein